MVLVNEDTLVSHVILLFRKYKVSKMVVVNKANKVKGVLSYFDLIHFLTTEPDTKKTIHNQIVKKFMKSFVITVKDSDEVSEALELCLKKKIGSAVIVDEKKRPKDIITTHDFLNLIVESSSGMPVILNKAKKYFNNFLMTLHYSDSIKGAFSAYISSKGKRAYIKVSHRHRR